MRTHPILTAAALLGMVSAAPAQVYLPNTSGDFSLFADGELAGQNGWAAVTTTPTLGQISNGRMVSQFSSTTKPSVRYPFASAVPNTPGSSYFVGLTFRLNQLGNSEVLSTVTSDGSTGVRLRLQLSSNTFSIAGGPAPFGGVSYTFDPSFQIVPGTEYRLVLSYDFLAGSGNDVVELFVNPTSPTRAANTPLLSYENFFPDWIDLASLVALQFGSGPIPGTPGYDVGRVIAAGDFASVYSFITPVPEPSSLGLAGLAAAAGIARWRRKQRT